MSAGFVLSRAAEQDLLKILAHYGSTAGWNVAGSVQEKFEEAFRLIGEDPGIGHRWPRSPHRIYRVYEYLVYYAPDDRPVVIARIIHGATNPASLHL